MSKRIILGLIAGTAVFGSVFGLAATLEVNTNTISADEVAISTCDNDGVHAEYVYNPATGTNTHVKVTDIDDDCLGSKVTVRVFSGTAGNYTLLTYGQQDVEAADPVEADDNVANVLLNAAQDPELLTQIEVVINGNQVDES